MGFFKDLGKFGKSVAESVTGGLSNRQEQIEANLATQQTNAQLAVIQARNEQMQAEANAELVSNVTYVMIFALVAVLGFILYKRLK